ncbi:NUDIX hydrolase [Methylobacterium sp. 4-46]|uniref:NUDIX hydrolase n=1 Tax=unclassified Methylobacterium TaxID=2615210 RepID=UPI000152E52D|nr:MULTISPECIES: NUDIX hydrolase [Methylobacterium]ACA15957.1 NUDIX hydrolase [Methylobacterium sp. 4-46]WFT81673.1 NUDIX hydrolase [Methylobacterium nodulans]
MSAKASLSRAAHLTAALAPYDWAWARENAAGIAAHWRRRLAERPALFNGRVLLANHVEIRGRTVAMRLFETDFATFTAFRDLGFPDPAVVNVFAAVAPLSRDGAYLLGRMNAHTASAGQVYFACGTPDPSDVRPDGSVDLAASAVRELAEETGLAPPEGAAEEWVLVRHGGHLALLRPVAMGEPAADLLARAEAHLAAEEVPELAGLVVVRGPGDIDPSVMPAFVQAFLHDAFLLA